LTKRILLVKSVDKIYCRVTISEETKFLTVSLATLTAFFNTFLQLPIHRKTASLSMKKNITILLHNWLEAIKYKKACFSLPVLTSAAAAQFFSPKMLTGTP